MNPLPGAGVCQGDFAASVKKILPIYQCGILAIVTSIGGNSPIIAVDLRHKLLDRPRGVGIIRFTQSRVPGGPHAPTLGL
jgi:hypothetical protein